MKKILRYILLCLPLVFLMSHNASAVNYDVNVQRFCYVRSYPNNGISSVLWTNWETGNSTNALSADGSIWLSRIYILSDSNFYSGCSAPQRGDIFQINFSISNLTDNNALDAFVWSFGSGNNTFEFVDWDFKQLDNSEGSLTLYYMNTGYNSSPSALDIRPAGAAARIGRLYANETMVFTGITMYRPLGQQDLSSIEDAVDGVAGAIESLENSINNINQDEADATQDAADAAQDAADSSSSDAESATTGLINVIGGFVSAITNATPSNCIINGHINNNFDMGNLDLCAMPAPPFIQIIGSLILISVCIPFCIIMFNRFIGLFRSFQG